VQLSAVQFCGVCKMLEFTCGSLSVLISISAIFTTHNFTLTYVILFTSYLLFMILTSLSYVDSFDILLMILACLSVFMSVY
jgi:hypothetical protein